MKFNKKKFLNLLKSSESKEKRFILLCAFIGVFAGLLAVAFRLSIEAVFAVAWKFGAVAGEDNRIWVMPLIPALGGLVVGACVSTFAKSASGSGIPQTKAAYYNNFGVFKWRDAVYRFILGVVFCGLGNSAGREGPTVHLCSAAASSLAQTCGFAKQQVQNAVPAGMGAGIAASFNAPLAAISFVFEELLGGFGEAKKNGGVIMAVIIAAAVARIILGENPILPIAISEFHTGWWMLLALPIALLSGVTGEAFLGLLLKFRGFARFKLRLPLCITAALGGLAVGVMGMLAYSDTGYNSVFSVGYSILIPAALGSVGLKAMLILFFMKFLATVTNYSMGGSGGLFSPTLVIGGMLGGIVGTLFCGLFGADLSMIGACVLLGMGACFASIIRCPMTSILMIFELTLNYSLILPLIATNLISYMIARRARPLGLYDSLLAQDGVTLRKMPIVRGNRDWANLPVSAIMTFNPECLSATDTPKEALRKIEMKSLKFRAYPVLDSNAKYIGIIEEKRLRELSDCNKVLSEIIIRKAKDNFIYADDSIARAANFFVETDKFEACVVSGARPDAIVGLLTLHDIARYSCATR